MNFISESNLEVLLSDKLDFLFILNMDGNIIEMNGTVNSILGYTYKDLNPKNFLTVYSPCYREKVGAIIRLAIKGYTSSYPYPFVTKTGEIIPVDTKFYTGHWKGENVTAIVSTNLAAQYFSKEIFYSIFNGSQIMMAISAIDTNVVFNVNNAFTKTLGYTLEEISGKSSNELDVYCDLSQKEAMLEQLAIKGRAEGEATIKTKSGELLECLFTFEQISIQNNDYLFETITNITQRKLIEEKLKHLNHQQKLLADVAQLLNKPSDFDEIINTVLRLVGLHSKVSCVYIFENSADGKFSSNAYEWCNEGIKEKKDELQMLSNETNPSWKKFFNENGRIFSENIQELPPDMINLLEPLHVKSILAYPIYVQNHFWGFMGLSECFKNKNWMEDEMNLLLTITNNIANALERKLYLNQFQDSEMRLRLALSGAREGMWSWDFLKDEMYFTDVCYSMLGYKPDNLPKTEHWWKELVHPEDLPRTLRDFENHKKNKTDYYESTFRLKDKSGEWKWILGHGKVIERDKDDKPVRAVGTHIDISKQKKIEEQMQELIATRDKLFSIISHDLRGPVGNCMQTIELLTDEMDLTPDLQASLLNELKETSKNTFHLLENLLNWSRSQQNEIVCNSKSININELIAQNISLHSAMASKKSIGIQFDENVNYKVYADYDMINLVVRNLLSNAIKFTREQGQITISISEQSGFIEVVVADNGVGMSQETVDNLFVENQLHSTYGTNNEKGSGLGLLLCQNFVSRNGGTIKVESTLGEGSKFFFTLPING